jgi:hypothetical protein
MTCPRWWASRSASADDPTIARPIATPSATAATPTTTLPTALAIESPRSPRSHIASDSNAKAENVV